MEIRKVVVWDRNRRVELQSKQAGDVDMDGVFVMKIRVLWSAAVLGLIAVAAPTLYCAYQCHIR